MDTKTISEQLENIADQIRRIVVLMTVEQTTVNPEKEHRLKNNLCLLCGKPIRKKPVRGNHDYCTTIINDDIRAKKTTEQIAIAQGILLPAKEGGRPPSDAKKALLEMQEATLKQLQAPETPKAPETKRGKKGS